jgi:hypothetical protein
MKQDNRDCGAPLSDESRFAPVTYLSARSNVLNDAAGMPRRVPSCPSGMPCRRCLVPSRLHFPRCCSDALPVPSLPKSCLLALLGALQQSRGRPANSSWCGRRKLAHSPLGLLRALFLSQLHTSRVDAVCSSSNSRPCALWVACATLLKGEAAGGSVWACRRRAG